MPAMVMGAQESILAMKMLRIAIWLNCLVSLILALSLLVAWMTIFNLRNRPKIGVIRRKRRILIEF